MEIFCGKLRFFSGFRFYRKKIIKNGGFKMSKRKMVNFQFLNNNFKDVKKSIESGNVYVCRFPDGVSILVNKGEESGKLNFIMYNPISTMVTRAEMGNKEFMSLFNEVLTHLSREHYEFEDNEGKNVIEQFDSIAEALMALKQGSFRGYKVRILS